MYIADLHIHSKYSRATSKNGDLNHLDFWARRKGIGLVGTGDFTHPAWREELAAKLVPAEEGFYRLAESERLRDIREFSISPRFVVSGEISTIYKQDGRVRKVHSVILLPSLDAAERLSLKLEQVGNIRSDGRPILGISAKDILALTLDVCADAVFIPAHIWTPHFSVFGAFSGFESIEECFGDLAPHIRALETGLSSDPPMNRRVPALDGYTLVSDSDAHSPAKLGRESNLISAPLSYPALKRALETGEGFGGTIEFFPEEGKYHLDGHRACGLRLTPKETLAYGGRCPVCGKKITVGVLHRLEELASRGEDFVLPGAKPFEHLMPLPEALASSLGVSESSEKTEKLYEKLLLALGSEAEILREREISEIARAGGELAAEGIRRLRAGEVYKAAGYDGEYGKISLFTEKERASFVGQMSCLSEVAVTKAPAKQGKKPMEEAKEEESMPAVRNEAQEEAAECGARVVAVVAGPGTGKTRTLVERIARMVEKGVKAEEITAVTFTVRAAEELKERLEKRLGKRAAKIAAGTFHSLCYGLLKDRFALADRAAALELAGKVSAEFGTGLSPRAFLDAVSAYKNKLNTAHAAAAEEYTRRLREKNALDYDDLISETLAQRLSNKHFSHLLVDEFQDVNPAQYELISMWAGENGTLFAIGDPDQAIYSFRGAAADCFGRLKADHPDAAFIRLTKNYRSSPEIVEAALCAISHNPGERALEPALSPCGAVRAVKCTSEGAEGVFAAREIARMTGGLDMLAKGREEKVRAFGEIAVLARTHRQLETIERCLRREDIPCVLTGGPDLLETPETGGTIAFFVAISEENAAEREQAETFLGGRENFESAREKFLPELGGRPRKILEKWKEYLHISSAAFDKLIAVAHYAEMREFLRAMRFGREGDVKLPEGGARAGAVRLSTLHGAKGLEFPVVFLCGADENMLPLSVGGKTDEEEERRLFYVGMTRAKEELILCCGNRPSPFLGELPANVKQENAETAKYKQLTLF